MDMITHSMSWYFLKKWFYDVDSKKILILFICWALFPDIDILWSFNDYKLHRVLTHSIFMLPFVSIIPSFIFYHIFKKEIKYKIIYFIFFVWIILHIFLDTIIIWWTPLFWPISDKYYSLNIYTFVFEPLFLPVYLYFLFYFLKIIKSVTMKTVKIMTFYMIFVFVFKLSLLFYVDQLSHVNNNTVIGMIKSPSDLIIQRYFNSFWTYWDKIHWEIIDLYSWNIVENYEKDVYVDKNLYCSNLHNGYLFSENGFVWDIRYGTILWDSGNCFFWIKID